MVLVDACSIMEYHGSQAHIELVSESTRQHSAMKHRLSPGAAPAVACETVAAANVAYAKQARCTIMEYYDQAKKLDWLQTTLFESSIQDWKIIY